MILASPFASLAHWIIGCSISLNTICFQALIQCMISLYDRFQIWRKVSKWRDNMSRFAMMAHTEWWISHEVSTSLDQYGVSKLAKKAINKWKLLNLAFVSDQMVRDAKSANAFFIPVDTL